MVAEYRDAVVHPPELHARLGERLANRLVDGIVAFVVTYIRLEQFLAKCTGPVSHERKVIPQVYNANERVGFPNQVLEHQSGGV